MLFFFEYLAASAAKYRKKKLQSRDCLKLTGKQAGIGLQRENIRFSDIQKVETLILVILGSELTHFERTPLPSNPFNPFLDPAVWKSILPRKWRTAKPTSLMQVEKNRRFLLEVRCQRRPEVHCHHFIPVPCRTRISCDVIATFNLCIFDAFGQDSLTM